MEELRGKSRLNRCCGGGGMCVCVGGGFLRSDSLCYMERSGTRDTEAGIEGGKECVGEIRRGSGAFTLYSFDS